MAASRRVLVFALGGTISMGDRNESGAVPSLSGAQIGARVQVSDVDVTWVDVTRQPSTSLRIDDIIAVAQRISAADADGFVVTQGTDTIEETAVLLDLLCHGDEPVVVTGSMRAPLDPGSDGPANVDAAIRVAADSQTRGLGCLVAFAGAVHYARDVRKTHTANVSPYTSPNIGTVGAVVEGRFRKHGANLRRVLLPTPVLGETASVGLMTMGLDDSGEWLSLVADHLDGLVVAGFGGGHVPAWMVDDLAKLAMRIPVVLATRVHSGPVLECTYGYSGSETDLLSRGLISAGLLAAVKARMLLMVLLRNRATRQEISSAFSTLGSR